MLSIFNMFNDSEKGNNIMARTKTSKTTKIRNLFNTGVDVS